MSHPASEPSREQRINQPALPQDALFSHPSTPQALAQRHPALAERVNWRATPFSAGHRTNVSVDGQPHPGDQRQPATDLDQ